MEKIKTLKMLLSGGNMKFGNPVDDFKKKLSEGHYNSDNVQMKKLLRKIDSRHCRFSLNTLFSRTIKNDLKWSNP